MFKTLRYILKHRHEYRFYLYSIFFLNVICIIATLLIPIFLGYCIDNIIGEKEVNFQSVINNLAIIALLTVLIAILTWMTLFIVTLLVQGHIARLRMKMLEKFRLLPLKYIDGSSKGDLITRFSIDVENIGEGISQFIIVGFSGILLIVSTIGFLIYSNLIIGLIIVILTPIAFLATNYIGARNRNLFKEVASITGQMNGYSSEIFTGHKIIKTLNFQEKAFVNYDQLNQKLKIVGTKSQFYAVMTGPVSRLINYSIYTIVGVTGYLILLSNPGTLTVGVIARLLFYCKRYSAPFNDLSAIISILTTTSVSIQRIENILELEEETPDCSDCQITTFNSQIEFKNVDFSYEIDKPLIKNFNLTIKKGYQVAIVGPTGAGKSTIINLLLRFYDINSGDILIDGKSIYNIKRSNLRKFFGLVLQDSYLFKGSIADNISFVKKGATREEIQIAAKKAHADHFILQLPKGYDTIISEDGNNLSSGQKQLISIARIMLLDPDILILDEATSNIDTRTEALISTVYSQMMSNKTSFVVAHRLSTIINSDLILVLKDGQIIEQGTHQELLKEDTFYKKLYDKQFEI